MQVFSQVFCYLRDLIHPSSFVWQCSHQGGCAGPSTCLCWEAESHPAFQTIHSPIISACWRRIKVFREQESQAQSHRQEDVLPALQPCHIFYGFGPDMHTYLESPVLLKKSGNSIISPSNEFSVLKFLLHADILACIPLSCILSGCLCASNFSPHRFLIWMLSLFSIIEKSFMRAFLFLGHPFQVMCHPPA